MNDLRLFTGRGKALRLDSLPPEAWEIISGKQGDGTDVAKLYSVVGVLRRGVNLRANGVASMPFEVRRNDEAIYQSDDQPPKGLEWMGGLRRLLWKTETAVILEGRAYWENQQNLIKTRGLQWLRPDSVTPIFNKPGKQGFDEKLPVGDVLRFDRKLSATKTIRLERENVIYFWPPDYRVEIGPAESTDGMAAGIPAGVINNLDNFLSGYFERGMIKATLLKYLSPVSPAEGERVKEWWRRVFTGVKNAFATEVVRGDFDVMTIGEGVKDIRDASLSQSEKEDIAIALGVPQSKLFANAANFATKQSDDQMFIEDTIMPEVDWIFEVLNEQLFGPMGLFIVARPESLSVMQTDESDRAASLAQLQTAGVPLKLAMEILGYDLSQEQWAMLEEEEEEPVTEGTDAPKNLSGAAGLNGAQITAVLDVLERMATGAINSTIAFELLVAVGIDPDKAQRIVSQDIEPATVPSIPQASPSVSDIMRAEEVRRLRRWATKRDNPDPADFRSDVLTPAEIRMVLAYGSAGTEAQFQDALRRFNELIEHVESD